MKLSPGNGCVISDFGNNVGHDVRDAKVPVVELTVQVADAAGEGRRESYCVRAHKLVGIFESNSHRPVIVRMVSHAKLGRAAVMYSQVDVRIFVHGNRKIGWQRRQSVSVGREPAPRLAAQELPLAVSDVQPVEAQAQGMRVGGLEDSSRIIAIEIGFHESGHVVGAELFRDLQVEPRVLCGRLELGEMSLGRIAERDRAEGGGRGVPSIGSTEDVFKIHKATGREIGAANAE